MSADLAEIGVAFDTSGLQRGEQAMQQAEKTAARLGAAATAIGTATTKMSKEYEAASNLARKQTKALEDQVNTLGRSVGQNAQALRMLPAQMTDVFVGLTTGQSPMMVLLQQGGQLKDMFGGVGAAARAVGGFIMGLVNPFTIAAAAAGALMFAAQSGADEMKALNRAMILSGNQAGTTSSQMQQAALRVSQSVGTIGKASEVIGMLVSSGQIDNQYLDRYTQLTIRLDRLGIEAKDTVGDLAALGKDPVQAALKLNESMNFLDTTTYRLIKSQQDLGQINGAAESAQNAYASAMEQRATKLEQNLGYVERAWQGVKDMAKGAWDAMKGIGRADEVDAQLAKVQAQLHYARTGDLTARSGESSLVEEERRLLRIKEHQEGSAAAEKAQADQMRAMTEYDKMREASLPRQERLEREKARAMQLGKDALVDQEDIEKTIANIAYEQTKLGIEAQIERLNGVAASAEARSKAVLDNLDTQRKTGVINEQTYIQQAAQAEVAAMQVKRSTLEQQIALKSKERDSERDVAALRRQLDLEDIQIANRRKQAQNDVIVLIYQRQMATEKLVMAQQEEARQEEAMARVEADKRFNAAQLSVAAYAQSLDDANAEMAFQNTLIGKTVEEQTKLNEQHRIANALRDAKRKIETDSRGGNLTADQVNELNTDAEAAAAKALSQLDTNLYIKKWREANQQVAETLYDAITGKATSARDTIKKLFDQLVLRPLLMPVMQQAASALLGGLFGGPAGAAGGVAAGGGIGGLGGVFSGLGGAMGLGGTIAGMGTAFTAGSTSVGVMAGSIAGGGGIMGGAAAALGAIPVAGWIALGAAAIAALASKSPGGPKSESGFGFGVDHRGDEAAARALVQGTQLQYLTLASQLGGTPGNLDLGVFSAADPKGTAKTQLAVEAALNGQALYSRAGRLGGIENVGRKPEELQAAIEEETRRVTLEALQHSQVPGAIGDYLKSLGDIDALGGDALKAAEAQLKMEVTRMQKAAAEQANLRVRELDLLLTDEGKLAFQRQREVDALDASNQELARRVFHLEDERKAAEVLNQAISDAKSSAKSYADFIGGVNTNIREYINRLNTTPDGLLPPGQRLVNSKTALMDQLTLANAGDRTALQSVTNYAEQYINAQKDLTASGSPTQDAISFVKNALSSLPKFETSEEYLARTIREALEGQTGSLTDVLKANFTELDTNLNGALDFTELKTYFGPLATDASIEKLIKSVDTNGDGQITMLDILNAQMTTSNETSKDLKDKIFDGLFGESGFLAGQFGKLDTSLNGLLDFKEMQDALAPLASDATIRELMGVLDTNGDGQISKLEIINANLITLGRITAEQRNTGASIVNYTPDVDLSGGQHFFFANGGIMTPQGPIPLRKFANGGVVDRPMAAIYGEGRMKEAIVPLPDGRSIRAVVQDSQNAELVREIRALRSRLDILVNVTASGARGTIDRLENVANSLAETATRARLTSSKAPVGV